jgi:hypothetical protein
VAVREHESGGAELLPLVRGVRRHRLLGEVHEMHRAGLSSGSRALWRGIRLRSRIR